MLRAGRECSVCKTWRFVAVEVARDRWRLQLDLPVPGHSGASVSAAGKIQSLSARETSERRACGLPLASLRRTLTLWKHQFTAAWRGFLSAKFPAVVNRTAHFPRSVHYRSGCKHRAGLRKEAQTLASDRSPGKVHPLSPMGTRKVLRPRAPRHATARPQRLARRECSGSKPALFKDAPLPRRP